MNEVDQLMDANEVIGEMDKQGHFLLPNFSPSLQSDAAGESTVSAQGARIDRDGDDSASPRQVPPEPIENNEKDDIQTTTAMKLMTGEEKLEIRKEQTLKAAARSNLNAQRTSQPDEEVGVVTCERDDASRRRQMVTERPENC